MQSAITHPYSYGFGREGLRILEELLGGHDAWELETVGPSPMFIAFYVAFTDDPECSFGAEHVAPGRDRESFLVSPRLLSRKPRLKNGSLIKLRLTWGFLRKHTTVRWSVAQTYAASR